MVHQHGAGVTSGQSLLRSRDALEVETGLIELHRLGVTFALPTLGLFPAQGKNCWCRGSER